MKSVGDLVKAVNLQISAFEGSSKKKKNNLLNALIEHLKDALPEDKECGPTLSNSSAVNFQVLARESDEKLTKVVNEIQLQLSAFEGRDVNNSQLEAFCQNIRSVLRVGSSNNEAIIVCEEQRPTHVEYKSLLNSKIGESSDSLNNTIPPNPSTSVLKRKTSLKSEESELHGHPRKRSNLRFCNNCKKYSRFSSDLALMAGHNGKIPPEEQFFANHLLVTLMLKNLPGNDLLRFRVMNKSLKEIATKLILNLQKAKITIYYPGFGGAHCVKQRTGGSRSLDDLNDCLHMSIRIFGEEQFPCNVVVLEKPEFDATDIQQFLRLCGHSIKSMRIELEESTSISAFKLYVILEVPCVQHLYLVKTPINWINRQVGLYPKPLEIREGVQLSNLRCLTVDIIISAKILQDLLQIATNLEEFKGFRDEYIDSFIAANKVRAIKELTFDPNSSKESMELYKKLGEANLKIKKLTLHLRSVYDKPNAWPTVEKSLTQILKSSADSLRFWLIQPLHFMIGLNICKLPGLNEINIDLMYDKPNWRKLFQSSFEAADMFPNLTSVKIDLRRRFENVEEGSDDVDEGRDEFYDYFDNYNPLDNVKTIEYVQHCSNTVLPVFWTRKFATVFPHLQYANFGKISNFPLAAKTIWKLSMLKKLDISVDIETVNINVNSANDDIFALDMAFTGLSNSKCMELFGELLNADVPVADTSTDPHKNFREFASILDLKHLQILNLQFYDCFDDIRSPYGMIISSLTGKAFRACPKLQVHLSVRPKNSQNLEDFKLTLTEHVGLYVSSGP